MPRVELTIARSGAALIDLELKAVLWIAERLDRRYEVTENEPVYP